MKSRLAGDIGAAEAARVYAGLLDHALTVAEDAAFASRFLYCADDDERDYFLTRLPATRWRVLVQSRGDLGERMYDAIAATLCVAPFVVLIGSDIADNHAADLERACRMLATDASASVLGPTADGGYWLIGLSGVRRAWFAGLEWGTGAVADSTAARLQADGLRVHRLALRHDVDVAADLAWLGENRRGT